MSGSPTSRSLEVMRERGYPLVQVVEKFNPHARVRQDLFGIIDILCVGAEGVVAVQATSDNGGNVAARVRKITESEALPVLRLQGWTIVIHGWKKRTSPLTGKVQWVLREVDLSGP